VSSIASKKSSPALSASFLYQDVISDYICKKHKFFNIFHFGFAAVSMILKIDQAISGSFSVYCQIAVLMPY
jgi:hypothetical protein